jgi:hypothetical protein
MCNQYFPPFCDGQHTGPTKSALFWVMATRKKTLAELKSEAIATPFSCSKFVVSGSAGIR